jgi:hypothetical protein
MTPQLALVPNPAAPASPNLAQHLTEDQFGELLSASSRAPGTSPADAHLLACAQCAAELAGLRESLSFFRHASTAYANNELRQMPQMSLPVRRPLLTPATQTTWAFAAAATFLIALLPMQSFRQHTLQPPPAVAASASSPAAESESDDALLNDINQEVSASVPAPMQALADPTAISAATAASVSISDQRKD